MTSHVYTTLREANRVRQAEWTGGEEVDILWRGNELGGEVGEALNVVKKLARERRGWPGSRATVDELAAELADVVICADLLAMTEDIDLDAAVAAKFNATSAKVGLTTRLSLDGAVEQAERMMLTITCLRIALSAETLEAAKVRIQAALDFAANDREALAEGAKWAPIDPALTTQSEA